MNNFEKEVRKALIEKNMTLLRLAEELEISMPYLYDIFKNARKANKQRGKICELLELDYFSLCNEDKLN